jgi:3-oxoadipate enol-lactonase
MSLANVNGADLYYEVHGEGPPLIFAHGVGGNHASWFQQVPYFSRWCQVVTFDHRGFGNSKDVPGGPGRSAFVEDLHALLDHLQIRQAALVAQSMGGWTCLGLALSYPERVSALVMADTLGGIDAPGLLHERLQQVRQATDKLPQLERVLSPGFRQRNPARSELYAQLASFNASTRQTLAGRYTVEVKSDKLAKLAVPVLFIVGREDVLVPPDVARLAAKLVPNAQLTEVADAGHSVYFEQPEVFNQRVLSFLETSGMANGGRI